MESSPTVLFSKVREEELKDIQQRREKVHLSTKLEDNLVGLSLSGGGVRSACFATGFIQALHAKGLWKWIDYLSTVSGGGYLGAFLSSAVVKEQAVQTPLNFPLREASGNRQLPHVLRFIYGGNYLLSAWELANKYLIGLVFANLAIFSALVALAAFVSLVWRSFDTHWFRDRAELLDLQQDIYAAFWPFLFFAAGWLCAWVLSYYRRGAEAPGIVARWLLHATAASFVLGIALLLGNGDIGLPWSGDPLTVNRSWWGSLVGLLLGSLLPLLQPKRLIMSGIQPKNQLERWIFVVVTTGMLVGIPVAIVGTLGRENISGYSNAPNRPFLRHDSDDLEGLGVLMGAGFNSPISPAKSSNSERVTALPKELLSDTLRDQASTLVESIDAYNKAEIAFKKSNEYFSNWPGHYLGRAYRVLGSCLGDDANSAAVYWNAKQQQYRAAQQLCETVDSTLLPSSQLFRHLSEGKAAPDKSPSKEFLKLLQNAQADPGHVEPHQFKLLNRVLLEERYPSIFRPRSEVRRTVCIEADQWYRLIIFLVALGAFALFGAWVDLNATSMHGYYRNRLARIFVVPKTSKSPSVPISDLDTTKFGAPYHLILASVGWFQRQLSHEDPAVSAADENGAPPLVHCLTGLSADAGPNANWVDSFLFSRRYCGSRATGYVDTKAYEGSIRGELNHIDLAEAIAVSGGAVSPSQVSNPFIAFLMFALNLRLGQWLPNPRRGEPRTRPTVLPMLWSLWENPEKRQYCFVADGGHCENLGVLALLRRRCRVVFAVDAGQDPDHHFDDLARVLRDARVHDGIRILPLTTTSDEWVEGIQAAEFRLNGDDKTLPKSSKHFLLARIVYPDGKPGLLVYVKPSIDGDEPVELLQYRNRNKAFPHEPTSDQLFDPAQVESYRQLGYHIGMQLLKGLPPEFREELEEEDEVTASDLSDALERMHLNRKSPMTTPELVAAHSLGERSVTATAGNGQGPSVKVAPPSKPKPR
jgi:hypothetical protein